MLFLGFASGLPLLLIFSSLSLWLREAGIERATVTMFSWAALGYSFKFIWAPLVDALRLPWLTRALGRRRGWILVAQVAVMAALVGMSAQDPQQGGATILYMACFAVLLGFAAATQDIVIDAYRIESAPPRMQALLSATYICGYRIGMLIAGAGALFLASWYGSVSGDYDYAAWRNTYLWMAAAMLIGVGATLCIAEPTGRVDEPAQPLGENMQLLGLFALAVFAFIAVYVLTAAPVGEIKSMLTGAFGNGALAGLVVAVLRLAFALAAAAMIATALVRVKWVAPSVVERNYVQPVRDFFARYGRHSAWLLLGLIGVYRISDIVLGVIANVFYQDLGFDKIQIAQASKTYGLLLTIAGGFLGGGLAYRYGVMRILFLGALLSAATNLLFVWLAGVGNDVTMLYLVLSADNLSAGLASAAFVAFLSALTNVRFTAVQFAIFTSLMTLLPKALGGYSGAMVDTIGYPAFFTFTAALGLPVLLLVYLAQRRLGGEIALPSATSN